MKLLQLCTYIILCVAIASCFTGVDSTPRITSSDVAAAGAVTTAEMEFLSTVVDRPPTTWAEGKQWLVSDNKISLIF